MIAAMYSDLTAWLCDRCCQTRADSTQTHCALCPMRAGALTIVRTYDGRQIWVHVICALFAVLWMLPSMIMDVCCALINMVRSFIVVVHLKLFLFSLTS